MIQVPRPSRSRAVTEFLRTEAGSGALLLVVALVALLWANSPWRAAYVDLWHTDLTVGSGTWAVEESLRHWVNDALMAGFFLLIGLEIKRELAVGELHDPRTALLPAVAAFGGMVVPVVVFMAIVGGGEAGAGWGVPMATDIAFVVGVLAVLGTRAPSSLKLFLLTLAIVDDIGAIVVIAVFYGAGVSLPWLAATGAAFLVTVAFRRAGVARAASYVPIGAATWYCAYRAGVHPTIAAVALGLLTPAGPVRGRAVLEDLERRLHPWSSYLVVPVFVLANTGIALSGGLLGRAATSRLTWAIGLGLVVGKTVGIAVASIGASRVGLALPSDLDRRHLMGAGALGGIGFTVSLLVATLAFPDDVLLAEAKIGILAGSLVSGVLGVLILARRKSPGPEVQAV